MTLVLAQTSELEYVPKYLFVSGDAQGASYKSRHVMKEFLRKRDTIRRQKQLAARSQSRVLPWLRREDMEQSNPEDSGSPESSDSSTVTTPQQSQWTRESQSPSFEHQFSHRYRELVDYLHGVVICRLYETDQSKNISSPATLMAKHLLKRPLPAHIFLSILSLNRDIELGQSPTSETIGLVLGGIRLLKQQIQNPNDDSIAAVISLWIYEVTLAMDVVQRMSRHDQILVSSNIQTHVDGLRRSLKCLGGPRNLSAETLWLLAW
ncbi:uncharacterized protein Z518_06437 [Rhinocladiella mackenziei CBS 650.93]|uniref:Uncharacterized protein n=1 Tax=Rhinocladiella mackenziei CBS 650.93 TaxID=1442369 RepID=A0A0D2J8X5_9EURO|nr:uncharacterized protein Z518_06437 [Rhinocladiella mackenziei CBS 650.93]KIX05565.1 hypothetical protein Z518_06437 [Rhinocladiella mackenziei CBS 650.93]